jgi:hypothetical protein
MYKIGTGYGGTVEGKVYKEVCLHGRQENVEWVYLEGTLYLRLSSVATLGCLQMYDPET